MRIVVAFALLVLLLVVGIAGFTAWTSGRRNGGAPSMGPDRFPRLTPFMAGRKSLRGLVNDLNSSHYVLELATAHATADAYFAAIHPAAAAARWELATSSPLRRVYCRPSGTIGTDNHDDEVTLTYDPQTAKVEINFHPLWQAAAKR
jgi:hypothetical protein